jgi:hypothetical protein
MSDTPETITPEPVDLSLPVPKFRIGDTIYWPATKTEHVVYACPDCGGSAVWQVKTAVTEFTVPCQRCRSYGKAPPRTLTAMRYLPDVKSMVIKSIKVERDSDPGKWGKARKVEYYEKGNSGWHVDEDTVFADRDEAMVIAVEKAAAENAALDARADEIRTREIACYDLTKALAAAEYDARVNVEIKYDKAVQLITDLKDGYMVSLYQCKTDDARLERIARHLLTEMGEDIPECWGEY